MSRLEDRKQIVKRLGQIYGDMNALSDEVIGIGHQIVCYSDQLRNHPQYTDDLVQLKNVCQETLNDITMSRYWSRLKTRSEKIFCVLLIHSKGLHHVDITRIYTKMENSDNTREQRSQIRALLCQLKKQGHLNATSYSFRNIVYSLKNQDYMADKLRIKLPVIS